eukprot:4195336-Pyramimonas_sp.AAC.1
MFDTDGQIIVRADEDAFENTPLSPHHPQIYDEFPSAWIFQRQPITEEGARGYMDVFTSLTRNELVLEQTRRKGMHGTTQSDVPGIFEDRHELALAANSGTMVDGILTILLDIGGNIDIIV